MQGTRMYVVFLFETCSYSQFIQSGVLPTFLSLVGMFPNNRTGSFSGLHCIYSFRNFNCDLFLFISNQSGSAKNDVYLWGKEQ